MKTTIAFYAVTAALIFGALYWMKTRWEPELQGNELAKLEELARLLGINTDAMVKEYGAYAAKSYFVNNWLLFAVALSISFILVFELPMLIARKH